VVEVPKLLGSWEANTTAKPAQILAAIDRHPGKVVVFLDVDCEVKAPLDQLATITGDVGFYIRTRYRRFGGIRFGARPGTVVIRPTAAARTYVEAWAAAAREAPLGSVDQSAQMVAMGRVPWCSFTMLPVEYCATVGDKVQAPIVLHDRASRGVSKVAQWRRLWPVP
jgi:hypothetical protein